VKQRFEAMLAAGFCPDEVRTYAKNLSAEHPSIARDRISAGLRLFGWTLPGLAEGSEQAIVATRQLAKRQFTWLRARCRRRVGSMRRIRDVGVEISR